MRIAVNVVCVSIGAMLRFASVTFFLQLFPKPQLEGAIKTYIQGISVYLSEVLKAIQLLWGIAFVAGRFVALAAFILLPIFTTNYLFHLFRKPNNIIILALLLLGIIFLLNTYRKNYIGLFTARRIA